MDNRALVYNWRIETKPAGIDTSGNANTKSNRAIAWINEFRQLDHTIYVGRTNESNPRLLVGLKSYVVPTFGIQVRGYRGAV